MLQASEIQRILQHRYPFLLVDRILELEPGKRAVGLKNITINEAFFQGHFPGNPIMPGVLILEAMAQVGGILLLATSGNEGKLAMFAGIDRARFRKQVLPGDQLVTQVELLKCRGEIGKVRVVGRVGGEVAAEAEYLFVLVREEEKESEGASAAGREA